MFEPPCTIELNCSCTTPPDAPVIYINTFLNICYVFWRHSCHPHGAVHQDLKLTNT